MTRARTPRLSIVAAVAVLATFMAPVLNDPASAGAADAAPAFRVTKTLARSHLNADGTESEISSNSVTVQVDTTTALRGRQDVNVTWSGAIPTGGIQPDVNSTAAPNQEYPVAILECRGVDSTEVPVSQRVDPTTCWTHGVDSRYLSLSFTSFGPARMDRYASASDRAAVVDRPANLPAACGGATANERWVPFVGVDGTHYNYGNNGCAGLPPEDFVFDSSAQSVPQNATFAATTSDGTGTAKFDVWSDAENSSLGCSATVKCTLEVIPIVGISCDPAGKSPDSQPLPAADIPDPADTDNTPRAISGCESGRNYAPGALATASNSANLAVSGLLWWSASNWRNRFSVPLDFAPVSHACDVTSGGSPVAVYGSELMAEATEQWAPAFCSDPSLFKLTHVQTSEPLARTLLNDPTSDVHAAFSSQSPIGGFPSPTVQAPVAISGFTVAFNVDDSHGRAVSNLRLTPRLLAKLMTESYPGDDFNRFASGQFPYLAKNPINVTKDPEFQALNPGIAAANGLPGAATLVLPSGESDVVEALTSYIEADPEARAWLSGRPDPWGMVVNPAYRSSLLPLPVLRWPLNDTTLPDFAGQVTCQTSDPSPWLPLVASPTPSLATTTLAVQFASPPSKTKCTSLSSDPTAPVQWAPFGREVPGQRFILGVTSLGDAHRYDLQSAALQSQSTVSDFGVTFGDAAGRTFVAPTPDSLKSAAAMLVMDPSTNTWTMPYDKLASDPAGAHAYPGTMIINADVPTSGLSAVNAGDYAKLLRFAAGVGQSPGTGNGQLPDGYLPMTAADGLAKQIDYTLRSAAAVQAQKGTVPPLIPVPGMPVIGTPPAAPGGSSAGAVSSNPVGLATGSTTASNRGSSPSGNASPVADRAKTPSLNSGLAQALLPTLIGGGLLAALISGGVLVRPRTAVAGRRRRLSGRWRVPLRLQGRRQ